MTETINVLSKTVDNRKDQKIPSQSSQPSNVAKCSSSTIGSNTNHGGTMILFIMFILSVIVFICWRKFRTTNKSFESEYKREYTPRYSSVQPIYTKTEPKYYSDTATRTLHSKSSTYDEDTAITTLSVAAAVTPFISSFIENNEPPSSKKTNYQYDNGTSSYDTNDSSSNFDNPDFGGGESGGGGSDSSWDE